MSILLVRHADAGNRSAWQAEDSLRPLTQKGLQQAVDLAKQLLPCHPGRLLSSPHVRCVETLEPLAVALGVTVEEHPDLAEGQAHEAIELFRSLLDLPTGQVALCSHGDVVDTLLFVLKEEYRLDLGPSPRAEKGSTWQIRVEDGRPLGATYLAPAKAS
jgi:8-oxo-dGTP diphosphatase